MNMENHMVPERVRILHDGAELTNGARDAEYGPPAVNMAASAALKSAFRDHMARAISGAELEAIDMCLTKLGRLATGTPKRDTYVDAATYLAIAGEIALAEVRPSPDQVVAASTRYNEGYDDALKLRTQNSDDADYLEGWKDAITTFWRLAV